MRDHGEPGKQHQEDADSQRAPSVSPSTNACIREVPNMAVDHLNDEQDADGRGGGSSGDRDPRAGPAGLPWCSWWSCLSSSVRQELTRVWRT